MGDLDKDVDMFLKLVSDSRYIVAFTGAGISAESGIPTFRGKDGLWNRFKPEELASFDGFLRDPLRVWRWYAWRMKIIKSAEPNYAHRALAVMEKHGIVKAIITQNIDGLHHRAGSRNVIELHGSIWRVRCIRCSFRDSLTDPPKEDLLPLKCPRCGDLLRPDVVWFGEALDNSTWMKALKETISSDLFIVIGTSGVVYPAAELPYIARDNGSKIIVIDPNSTSFDSIADLRIWFRASQFFKKIMEIYGF